MQKDVTNIQVSLMDGEYLETRKRKATKQPNYYRIGNGTMNKHRIKSIDLLGEVMAMTKAEQLVIATVKELLPWDSQTGEVYIKSSELFTKSEAVVFRRGFKLLKNKDLVRRTKQSHYMINPAALIPLDFQKALVLWEASKDN